jgi:hypothetical protein
MGGMMGGMMGRMGRGGAGGGPNAGDMMKGQQQRMQDMMKNMAGRGPGAPGMGGPPAGAGGGLAARTGGGAPGANTDPGAADLRSPEGAVRGFLAALKAKDLDRLNESTALRAQIEASAKHRDLFKKIFELTLSDSELDDIAKTLDGYQVVGENPVKSTGRLDVIIRKNTNDGGWLTRKVTVRHEKKGWGVMDVGAALQFKATGRIPAKKARTY